MGTTVDKLNKLKVTKEAIRVAINNKGGTLTENDTFASYPTAIENIQTGETNIHVDYLDGDGTLLKREYLNEGDTTTPPDDPNLDSEYLIFDGWSDTEYTNITESKTIYAKYRTKDNATYIFTYIPTANKAITLKFDGTITNVDWGDGTIDTTLSHTYSAVGYYVIKVVGGTSISNYILGNSDDNANVLKCYISNTITRINSSSFSVCRSLKNIILPANLIGVGDSAFNACYSLTNIILPNSIVGIGDYAFSNCSALTSVILPNSITNIFDNTFNACSALTNITLPNSIISIGKEAFKNCSSLTNIILPDGVTNIGDYAFNSCSALTNITLPNSMISMGNSVFSSCSSLTNITLPNGIKNIGTRLFNNCKSIVNINLPDGVTSISDYAFQTCYSLANITLPNSITNLGTYIFQYCYSLTNITLPSGITNIGNYIFSNCYNLEKLIINANSVITIQSTSFSTNAYNTKFYVPDNLVEDYKVATNWVNFADRIYPISSLPKE